MLNLILQSFFIHPDKNFLDTSFFYWHKIEKVFKILKYHAAPPAFLRNSKKV